MEKVRRTKKDLQHSKSQQEENDKKIRDITENRSSYNRNRSPRLSKTYDEDFKIANRSPPQLVASTTGEGDTLKSHGKENVDDKFVKKSPRRSIESVKTNKINAKKKLHEFGVSVDMDDGDVDESGVKGLSKLPQEEESSKFDISWGSSNKSKAFNKDVPEKTHFKGRANDQVVSDRREMSQNVQKLEDVKNVDGHKRSKSKSPVFLEELNKTLLERQEREPKTNKNTNVIANESDDDGDLISYFKGLFGKETSVTTTTTTTTTTDHNENDDTNKDTNKDKKEKRERKNMKQEGPVTTSEKYAVNHKDEDKEKVGKENKHMKDRDTQKDKEKHHKKTKKVRKKSNDTDAHSEGEDELSKKQGISDVTPTTPSFLDFMEKKKQLPVDLNTESNNVTSSKETRAYPLSFENNLNANEQLSNKLSTIDNEIIEDIFEVNDKKKPLQRQKHVSSVDVGNKNKKTTNQENSVKEKRLSKDKFEDVSKSKLNVSFDDLLQKDRNFNNNSIIRPSSADDVKNFTSTPKKDKLVKSATHRKSTDVYTMPSNSKDLKDMIYYQWLEKKKIQTKGEIKSKMLAQKKAAKDAEAEANDRKLAAKKTFDAWNDSKTELLSSQKEKKKEVKKSEKEKMEETVQQKRDAEKYFEKWKREKDGRLKKLHHQKKKEEKEKDKETLLSNRQKSEDALKAFESWKSLKEKDLVEVKKKSKEEKAKIGEEKLLAFEKKQEALRAYETWKSNNNNRTRAPSPQLTQKAWSPASRNLNSTIPENVQPVIIRNRNVSR